MQIGIGLGLEYSRLSGCDANTDAFIIEVDTAKAGASNSDQFEFTGALGDYDVVAKQNGTQVATFNDLSGQETITLPSSGVYNLEVKSKEVNGFNRIQFNNGGDKLKITDIKQWGDVVWSSFSESFFGCLNTLATATDIPNLSSVTVMQNMFRDATSANPDTSNWDVSNVTNMLSMFYGASSANPDTSNWDVSSVTRMGRMFESATVANPNTSNWDVSNVIDMGFMFTRASSANPDTSNWDVSSVTSMSFMFFEVPLGNPNTSNWDVSSVTNMGGMFFGATSANPDTSNWDVSSVTRMNNMFENATSANPDTSNWDVSSVTNMLSMFRDATSANPDTSNWDVSNVTNMSGMFFGATSANPNTSNWDVSNVTNMGFMFRDSNLSVENLTLIYENWSQLSLQQNVRFGAQGLKYNASGQSGKNIMVGQYNWSITDGGLV